MLQNAYFVAKIGADTAENEQHSAEILPTDALWRGPSPVLRGRPRRPARRALRPRSLHRERAARRPWAKFCKFLAGSFSAVSKRNFARKYAFDSIFQALQDLHPFAPLQSQNFRKKSVWKNSNFRENSAKFCKCRKICKILPNFKIFSLIIW